MGKDFCTEAILYRSNLSTGSGTPSWHRIYLWIGLITNVVQVSCVSTVVLPNFFSIAIFACGIVAAFANIGANIATPDGTFQMSDTSKLSVTNLWIFYLSSRALDFLASRSGASRIITRRSSLLCPYGGDDLILLSWKRHQQGLEMHQPSPMRDLLRLVSLLE